MEQQRTPSNFGDIVENFHSLLRRAMETDPGDHWRTHTKEAFDRRMRAFVAARKEVTEGCGS